MKKHFEATCVSEYLIDSFATYNLFIKLQIDYGLKQFAVHLHDQRI